MFLLFVLYIYLYLFIYLYLCTPIAPGPVIIEDVNRFNATHMTVLWIPLTLEEARGFVSSYTVRAFPTKSQTGHKILKAFPKNARSCILADLEPAATYLVSVFASNEEKEGATNPPILVENISVSETS